MKSYVSSCLYMDGDRKVQVGIDNILLIIMQIGIVRFQVMQLFFDMVL